MEVSYSDLKNKEVVNVSNGKRLGHIIDILFDDGSGGVKGLIVPGDKKFFRKTEDIFIPLARVKKIGDDVILVLLHNARNGGYVEQVSCAMPIKNERRFENQRNYYQVQGNNAPKTSFVRYKRISEKKYK